MQKLLPTSHLKDHGSNPTIAPEGGWPGIHCSSRLVCWRWGWLANHGWWGFEIEKANKGSLWRSIAQQWWNCHCKQWIILELVQSWRSMPPPSWLMSPVGRMHSFSKVASQPNMASYLLTFWPFAIWQWTGPTLDGKGPPSLAAAMAPSLIWNQELWLSCQSTSVLSLTPLMSQSTRKIGFWLCTFTTALPWRIYFVCRTSNFYFASCPFNACTLTPSAKSLNLLPPDLNNVIMANSF